MLGIRSWRVALKTAVGPNRRGGEMGGDPFVVGASILALVAEVEDEEMIREGSGGAILREGG